MRYSIVSLLVLFSFITSSFPVVAEGTPKEEVNQSFTLATVDFVQPKLEERNGELFFSVIVENQSNERKQYFPGVEFAQLDGEKLKNVVVERLAESWTLQGKEARPMEFTLPTPTFLSGSYRVSLGVVDESGRIVGRKFVATREFSSQGKVLIESCALDGQTLSDSFSLQQSSGDIPEILCKIQSSSVTTPAKLEVRRTKTPYLELDDLGSTTIDFSSNETEVRLPLKKQLPVGAYQMEVSVSNESGKILGMPFRIPMSVSGIGGRILGIADTELIDAEGKQSFPIAFGYELYSNKGEYQAKVELSSGGNLCGTPEVFNLDVNQNLASRTVALVGTCDTPRVTVRILSGGIELHFLEKNLSSVDKVNMAHNEQNADDQSASFWERGKSLLWAVLPWSLIGIIVLILAYRRLRMAKMLVFLIGALVVGMWQSPIAQAGSTSFMLFYICGGTGCPMATTVFYNFDTNNDTYAPGENISVTFRIGSDDYPQGFCPFVSLGINGGSYTGDQVLGCYTAQDFRGGDLVFTLSQTAPMTPGPFTLNFSVGLNGYMVPPVQSIPLTVSAPTTCTWPGGPIAWGPSNACGAYAGPVTLNIGQSSGPYPNTNIGYTGSLSSLCTATGWQITSATCTALPPTASITSAGPVAVLEKSWWKKALSYITGYDSVARAGGTTTITAGQNGRINWSSTNAGSCTITGGSGAYAVNFSSTSGSHTFYGMSAGTYTYNVSCSGPGGSASDSTTIVVNAPTCDWGGGNLTWGAGCQTYYGPVSFNVGQSTGLLSNTNASYTGTVTYSCTGSGWQAISPICTPVLTETPTGLSAVAGGCGSGAINLSWNPVAGATSYSIRADGVTVYTGGATSYTHNVANNGSLHTYNVNATGGAGTSSWSAPVNANAPSTCSGGAPATPTGLSAAPAACGTGQINLSWNPVAGATSYQLRDGGTVIYSAGATSYAHTGLTAGSSHSYTVRATNADGSSSYSASASALAPSACSAAAPTTSASPGACGSGTINVSWNSVAGTASYQLRRDGTVLEVGNVTSYNHTGLTGGTNHTYSTQSTPFSGAPTGYGNTASATAPNNCGTPPPAPTGLVQDSPTCGPNQTIYISWNPVPSADWYHIWVNTSGTYVWMDQIPSTGTTWSFTADNIGDTVRFWVYAENSAGMSAGRASLTAQAGSATACPECTGTRPTGSRVYSGDSPPSSSRAWQYSATNTSRDCQYYCDPLYTWDGATCQPLYHCTGSMPANAQLRGSGEDDFLTADTPYTYSAVSTAAKCEYRCSTGYTHDIVAGADVCVPATYLIRSTTGPNGTIAPLGNTNVPYKGSRTYTMTPNGGYVIDDVLVDGVSQGAIASYTFSNVSAPHTISVSFISATSTYISASPMNCIIADGNDSCTSYLTWNAPTAVTPQVKNSSTGVVVYAGATGSNQPVAVPYPGMSYNLTDGATVLDTTPLISAQCAAGSVWNGTACQVAAATGTVDTFTDPCTIAVGQSTCSFSTSWTTSLSGVNSVFVEVRSADGTRAQSVGFNGSGSNTWPVGGYVGAPVGQWYVRLMDASSNILDEKPFMVQCAAGSTWVAALGCVAAPTVDLKIDGSDGPLSLSGGNMTLSWITNGASSCSAAGPGWSGARPTSSAGETIPAFTGTYTLTCTNGSVDGTDSVDVALSCTPSCTSWTPCGPPCSGGDGTQSRTCTTATCLVTPQTQSCSTETCRDLNWKEIGQ